MGYGTIKVDMAGEGGDIIYLSVPLKNVQCKCNENKNDGLILYRTTKTASVHINLGAITFSSIPQKDPSNLFYTSPCELSGSIRVPHLARSSLRYDCHPLSPPLVPPTQDWRNACEYCRDRYLELYIAIYLLFDYLHLLVTYLFT